MASKVNPAACLRHCLTTSNRTALGQVQLTLLILWSITRIITFFCHLAVQECCHAAQVSVLAWQLFCQPGNLRKRGACLRCIYVALRVQDAGQRGGLQTLNSLGNNSPSAGLLP